MTEVKRANNRCMCTYVCMHVCMAFFWISSFCVQKDPCFSLIWSVGDWLKPKWQIPLMTLRNYLAALLSIRFTLHAFYFLFSNHINVKLSYLNRFSSRWIPQECSCKMGSVTANYQFIYFQHTRILHAVSDSFPVRFFHLFFFFIAFWHQLFPHIVRTCMKTESCEAALTM